MGANTRRYSKFTDKEVYLIASPYAQLRDAARVPDQLRVATDLGPDGAVVKSDSTMWKPINGSVDLGKADIFLGVAPSFTARAGGGAGKISFSTALVRNGGLKGYFYYPANSLDTTHAAGFYYTVLTDGQSATVYANTYVPGPGPGAEPVIPSSPTPFPGTAGSGTGVTTEVTLVSYAVPAGCMGKSGQIDYVTQLENNNSGDNKTIKVKLGSTALVSTTVTTATETAISSRVWNAGAHDVQLSGTTSFAGAVDTSAATTVSITLTKAAATSWALIPFCRFTLRA